MHVYTVEQRIVDHDLATAQQWEKLEAGRHGSDLGDCVGADAQRYIFDGGSVKGIYGHAAHVHVCTKEVGELFGGGIANHALHWVERQ